MLLRAAHLYFYTSFPTELDYLLLCSRNLLCVDFRSTHLSLFFLIALLFLHTYLTCPRCSSRQTFCLFSIDSISLNYVSNPFSYYLSQRFLYTYFLLISAVMCLLYVFKQTSLSPLLCNLTFSFIFPHLSSLQLQTALFLSTCPINCPHSCTLSYYILIVINNFLKVLTNYIHTH